MPTPLYRYSFIALFLLTGLFSCTQHSTAPANVAFHNVTSKYNALLQAREIMGEAEKTLFANRQDNYAILLPVLMPIDSMETKQVEKDLTAIIKKSSLVAERHQNAKYLPDAYVLLGKARLLQGDFKNAIETFKYVNTNYPESNARPDALIGLMRAYTEQDEYRSALRVAEVVRNLPLSKEQTLTYYLTKAYLHELNREYAIAAAILEESLPLMKKNEKKARVYYALGQLYELTSKPEKALEKYASVQRSRPNYDLSFYARLNALLNEPNTDPKVSFNKMLKDRKNADLQDQIYFAMGSFEERRGRIREALPFYKQAASRATERPEQLSAIYLRIADLSYEPLQEYEAAKMYYDSTIALNPRSLPNLAQITEKKKVLDAFVEHWKVIKTEDSLQRLAAMNPTQLDKYLETYVKQKKEKEAREKQIAEEKAARAQQEQILASSGMQPDNVQASNAWYFYNPASVQRGRQEFQEKWGTRTLEDNWRRATKETSLNPEAVAAARNANSTQSGSGNVTEVKLSPLQQEVETLKKTIPFGPDALVESKKKQEYAYYELGKIYRLGLGENDKAIATFEKLLALFPATQYEAETLYLSYLASEGTPRQNEFKNRLFQKFPESYYVRLINRSSLTPLTAGAEAAAQNLYAQAYEAYQKGEYANALTQTEQGLKQYAGNALEDKFALLKTMLVAKTENAEAYRKALTVFIDNYPSSNLVNMAKEMLTAAKGK
ncbi:tetratricopeptide repeat protein [Siphonobacter sp. SORGH_AS_0500]|uniref:type IX secretion system periplasmic lipoprotein PorW/SprE n=1 Tax=Siphonobacter sp. SORGH_AS_0500 TaxID=1864824 RepID=UPI0028552B0C|nr:tetratricopeptide repeat protein [Siphonobacter sp. SORGH_AS_0500]MDR6197054.1 tetratricopeptide (TPR) repeat protein [Siphonobacter sp. SORGH_AS_0500]